MELKELFVALPRSEAIIRIYKNYLSLNGSSVALLGLDGTGKIKLSYSQDDMRAGRFRCFIAKTDSSIMSFDYRMRGGCAIVACRSLVAFLAEHLDGYGSYRICPEDYVNDGNNIWYNIFIRNYDKKDSIKRDKPESV
jgi:hypothetical protein